VAGSKTDPKVIYNIRSRKIGGRFFDGKKGVFQGRWLAERRGGVEQYWKLWRRRVINTPGGRELDAILRKNRDFEAVPVPSEWKVDYIPFNSKTDERLEKWFRSETMARRFYKKLLRQQYPPKSQGIMEAQRPL